MKLAKFLAATVTVECPSCCDEIVEPKTGSYTWSLEDIEEMVEDDMTCSCTGCGEEVRIWLPKTAKVFV